MPIELLNDEYVQSANTLFHFMNKLQYLLNALNKKALVPDILTSNSNTVGIRMPANEMALKLIEYSGVPIATPSANISGKPSGVNLKEIIKDFEGKVDYFIDGGPSKIGISSTIVQVVEGVPRILRQGSITKAQIEEVFSKFRNE